MDHLNATLNQGKTLKCRTLQDASAVCYSFTIFICSRVQSYGVCGFELECSARQDKTRQIHQSLQYTEMHFLQYFSKVRRHCFRHQQKIILILEHK